MTIALGLLAKDGLVIAADTEETYGNFLKVDQGKVSAVLAAYQTPGQTRSRCCLITGAGSGHHIDAIGQQLMNCVADGEDRSQGDIERDFGVILRNFYSEHIIPFAAYPEDQRPSLELLIGTQLPRRLLVSQDNVLKDGSSYSAVGIGKLMAYPILGRFYRWPIDVRTAVLLASYVLFHVKDSVAGCGKSTDMWGFNGEYAFNLPRQATKELEDAVSPDYSPGSGEKRQGA